MQGCNVYGAGVACVPLSQNLFYFLYGGQGKKGGVKRRAKFGFFFFVDGGTILGKFGPLIYSWKLRPCKVNKCVIERAVVVFDDITSACSGSV